MANVLPPSSGCCAPCVPTTPASALPSVPTAPVAGNGSPEGEVVGFLGKLYTDLDTGLLYGFHGSNNTTLGWGLVSSPINVDWFGGDPSGLQDSAPAIQAAIDSLDSLRGGTVEFSPGTYILGSRIAINKVGVTLKGAGWHSTRIRALDNTVTSMFHPESAGGVTLQCRITGFYFYGFTLGPPVANYTGIPIDCRDYPFIDSRLDNCWFSLSFSTPWAFRGGLSFSLIDHCMIELCAGGIFLEGGAGISVNNGLISNCEFFRTNFAVRLDQGVAARATVEVRDLVIGSNYGQAGLQVESGTMYAKDIRIDVDTSLIGVDTSAIRVNGGTLHLDNATITEYTGSGAGTGANLKNGFVLQGAGNLYASNCRLTFAEDAISCSSTGELELLDCSFRDCSGDSILYGGTLSRLVARNCEFSRFGFGPSGTQKTGIRVRADYGLVTGCRFYDDASSNQLHISVASQTVAGEVFNNTFQGGKGGINVSNSAVGVRVEFPHASIPVGGSYAVRSKIFFPGPAAAGAEGAICVVAGTPGTWQRWAYINLSATLVWDPGNLADGTGETSPDITVTGAAIGDFAIVSAPYNLLGMVATAYVSATNVVKIRIHNGTGAPLDLGSGTWRVRVLGQL